VTDKETWELVKSVGSLVGLLTGAFVLADRLLRGRPYAAWVDLKNKVAFLEFVNTSNRHIYLFRCRTFPANGRVTRFQSIRGSLGDAFGLKHTIALAPGEKLNLRLVWQGSDEPHGTTLVFIPWRRAGASVSLPIVKLARWRDLGRLVEPDPEI